MMGSKLKFDTSEGRMPPFRHKGEGAFLYGTDVESRVLQPRGMQTESESASDEVGKSRKPKNSNGEEQHRPQPDLWSPQRNLDDQPGACLAFLGNHSAPSLSTDQVLL